jgi:hypothetical protein
MLQYTEPGVARKATTLQQKAPHVSYASSVVVSCFFCRETATQIALLWLSQEALNQDS